MLHQGALQRELFHPLVIEELRITELSSRTRRVRESVGRKTLLRALPLHRLLRASTRHRSEQQHSEVAALGRLAALNMPLVAHQLRLKASAPRSGSRNMPLIIGGSGPHPHLLEELFIDTLSIGKLFTLTLTARDSSAGA